MRSLILSENIFSDVEYLFKYFECQDTYEHSLKVANKAKEICRLFYISEEKGELAGLLHDISGIFLNSERIKVCDRFNILLYKEERQFPLITHQKISKVIAHDFLGIYDDEVLNAIACHTTLKSNPTKLDLALFVADKIEWD